MKKIAVNLISILLCLFLLCGCALPFETQSTVVYETAAPEISKFGDIEYVRPDVEALHEKAEELYAALSNPFKFKKVSALLEEFYSLYYDFDTMCVLAYIRSCHDMSDSFYAEEYSWLAEKDAEVQLLIDAVYTACAQSPHSPWMERLLFWDGFKEEYGGDGQEAWDEEYERYLSLAEEEARLLGEYRQMLAAPTVEIDGQELNYDEYMSGLESPDYAAFELYYEKYNPVFAEIYIELLQLRREQAELMGYSSYAEMAYDLFYGRDYSVEESELFMGYVKEHMAELGRELMENGVYIESALEAPGERELLLFLETAAEGFGGGIEDAFEFMREHELYDFELSANKVDSSFVIYLSAYNAPYLFLCPYGIQDDILAVFHEFGHYADNYIRAGAAESMDLSESFSQAMQFLCLSQVENILNEEELQELRRLNLLDMLDSYLQQTALAEFELRAYEMEEPSVEKLNELCLELSMDYGIYDEYSGSFNSYYWVDVSHLFDSPFYVISYPVSAGLALELYEQELEQEGAGSEKFVEMSESGLAGLMETVEYAALQDPMSETRIKATAKLIESAFN